MGVPRYWEKMDEIETLKSGVLIIIITKHQSNNNKVYSVQCLPYTLQAWRRVPFRYPLPPDTTLDVAALFSHFGYMQFTLNHD